MKTIFVSITRGVCARNILRAGVLDMLLAHNDIRVVIVVSSKLKDYFKKEFTHSRISLECIPNTNYSRWRKFFIILFNGLTYTDTEHKMLKFGGAHRRPVAKSVYWLQHTTFSILSRIKFIKHMARWIEQHLFIERDCDYLFTKYNPDTVFCSSLYSKLDIIIMKAARRFGVFSISMPKSWDTVGRLFLRCPADQIIVNNQFMKDWITKEQAISADRVVICGLPQFDIYKNKKQWLTRPQFCQRTNLDPNKPIILFASEGIWTAWDDTYIDDLIYNHKILDAYNLILRPHPSNIEEKLYHRFKCFPGVYVDDEHLRVTNMFGDHWDPTMENMDWFAEVLRAADAAITFMSTIVLDALSCGTPVVTIYYDLPSAKHLVPLRALYNSVHCHSVMREGSTPLARSGADVMKWIEKFLSNPDLLSQQRNRTIDNLCYKIDGQSSARIHDIIVATLKK